MLSNFKCVKSLWKFAFMAIAGSVTFTSVANETQLAQLTDGFNAQQVYGILFCLP